MNAAINILFPVKSIITIDYNVLKKIMLEWLPILPIQKHSAQNAKEVAFAWRSDACLIPLFHTGHESPESQRFFFLIRRVGGGGDS